MDASRVAGIPLPLHETDARHDLGPPDRGTVRDSRCNRQARYLDILAPRLGGVEVEQYVPGWIGKQSGPEHILPHAPGLEPPAGDLEPFGVMITWLPTFRPTRSSASEHKAIAAGDLKAPVDWIIVHSPAVPIPPSQADRCGSPMYAAA